MSLETVILYRRSGASTFDSGTEVHALRRATDYTRSGGRVALPSARLVWHLKAEDAGDTPPTLGDVIEDADAVRWVIDQPVQYATLGTRWRCPTVKERDSA
ncbi:MAG TPA: hypothetical protein VI172_09440 [Candidatus Dormibacteraeota bacterium]|jgi:hypothetical protein